LFPHFIESDSFAKLVIGFELHKNVPSELDPIIDTKLLAFVHGIGTRKNPNLSVSTERRFSLIDCDGYLHGCILVNYSIKTERQASVPLVGE
jgi:hypothetical protein